jgi:TldD protein
MRKRILLCFSAAAACLVAASLGGDAASDVQLRAMQDELARSTKLQLNNLDKPYFVQYASEDADQLVISGSLGGLTGYVHSRTRRPYIEVRVGDYRFDNSNSIYSGRTGAGLFPLDDDYSVMRNNLWLATDAAYKAAVEQITRKRTALRDIATPDNTPDLAPAKPVHLLLPPPGPISGDAAWKQVVASVSGRFVSHPAVTASGVRLLAISSAYRLINTEGTLVRIPQNLGQFEITASALAPDGSEVRDYRSFVALDPTALPSAQALAQAADEVASETERLAQAPKPDEYSGPVLFQGISAAQLMAEVITDAARLPRKPVAPLGSNNPGLHILESVWTTRLGAKVAPDWMSIVDDPTRRQFQNQPLAGTYPVDDEGVPAQPVVLVDKGTLKSFLLSREPVRNFNASNGHGRLPGGYGAEQAVIGNLFVQADQTVPEARLKTMLIEKVKAAGLNYGVLITRLNFPMTASVQELRSLGRQLQKQGYARTLTPPLLAYRIYPDGREELVRGFRFKEFSAKNLRDVDAASERSYVLNYINNGSSFDVVGFSSDVAPSSVVSPSLLFDDVDLMVADDDLSKPPIVPPPALVARQ